MELCLITLWDKSSLQGEVDLSDLIYLSISILSEGVRYNERTGGRQLLFNIIFIIYKIIVTSKA